MDKGNKNRGHKVVSLFLPMIPMQKIHTDRCEKKGQGLKKKNLGHRIGYFIHESGCGCSHDVMTEQKKIGWGYIDL